MTNFHSFVPETYMRHLRFVFLAAMAGVSSTAHAASLDLSKAVVVVREGDRPAAEKIAPAILTEEIATRTGLQWTVSEEWPVRRPIDYCTLRKDRRTLRRIATSPLRLWSAGLSHASHEGFSIRIQEKNRRAIPDCIHYWE